MFGFFHHRRIAAQRGFRVDEVGGVQRRAARFALVAIRLFVMTVRTFARDIAVGQKLLGLLVIILLRGLLNEFAFVVQFGEEGRGRLVVGRVGGAGVDVEGDAQLLERLFDNVVITVHYVLRGHTLFAGFQRNRYAVLIGAAEEKHLLAVVAEVAGIDVGRDVNAGQMTDMYRSVGVRQRRGDGIAFGFFFHIR